MQLVVMQHQQGPGVVGIGVGILRHGRYPTRRRTMAATEPT